MTVNRFNLADITSVSPRLPDIYAQVDAGAAGGTISGNVTMEIPSTPAPASTAVAERPFMDSVPAEYRESAWVKDIAQNEKPWDTMFKSYASAQEMIGKKANHVEIPGVGAAPEVVSAYNKAIGIPETPAGYAYTPPDISKEPEAVRTVLAARLNDTTFIDTMRAEAHKAGVTPKQFAAMATAFDNKQIAQIKAGMDIQTASSKTFAETEAKLLKATYGDNYEAAKTVAKDVLAKIIPKEIADSKNPNLALMVAANYINEKLFKNDTIGTANQGAPQETKAQIHAKITDLRAKPEFKDWTLPGHKAINQKVDELYKQMCAPGPTE